MFLSKYQSLLKMTNNTTTPNDTNNIEPVPQKYVPPRLSEINHLLLLSSINGMLHFFPSLKWIGNILTGVLTAPINFVHFIPGDMQIYFDRVGGWSYILKDSLLLSPLYIALAFIVNSDLLYKITNSIFSFARLPTFSQNKPTLLGLALHSLVYASLSNVVQFKSVYDP